MITLLAALLLTPAPLAAAEADARWVPFTLTPANQIRFTAQIDGRPATAILDTGVTTSTVSTDFAAAARFSVRAGPNALTVSGHVAAAWTEQHSIAFGSLTQAGTRLAVADLPAEATGGTTVDVLIGADMTAPYALDVDYEAHRFRLLPSGRLPFRGTAAPLRIATGWGFYVTEVTIGGTRIDRIVVDTGDGTGLTLSRAAVDRLPALPAMTTTLDYAIGGAVVADLAVLPEVRSAALTIRNVELRVEPTRGFADATGVSGRFGSALLQRYRVLLDPGAGRMVLAAGRDADRPPLRSTSGFLLGVRRDRLDVLHVMRGSPAEQAGWTAGDAICAIDGAAVEPDYETRDTARWPVAAAGRTVRLTDCAGRARPVTLRRFY